MRTHRKKDINQIFDLLYFLGRMACAFTGTCCLWITHKIISHSERFVNSFLKNNLFRIKKINSHFFRFIVYIALLFTSGS